MLKNTLHTAVYAIAIFEQHVFFVRIFITPVLCATSVCMKHITGVNF